MRVGILDRLGNVLGRKDAPIAVTNRPRNVGGNQRILGRIQLSRQTHIETLISAQSASAIPASPSGVYLSAAISAVKFSEAMIFVSGTSITGTSTGLSIVLYAYDVLSNVFHSVSTTAVAGTGATGTGQMGTPVVLQGAGFAALGLIKIGVQASAAYSGGTISITARFKG